VDGEVLFKDYEGKLLTFQEIEKKTKNREDFFDKYPSLYLFDILYINDQTLTNDDILTRRSFLEEYFGTPSQYLNLGKAEIIDLSEKEKAEKKIQKMMSNSLGSQCEGLFLKIVDKDTTFYDTSGSSRTQWIKYKGNVISKGKLSLHQRFRNVRFPRSHTHSSFLWQRKKNR